jgi:uncharacterized protein (DUF2236 family)
MTTTPMTIEQAARLFADAADALARIRASPRSTPEQKAAARAEFDRLQREFLGRVHADEARRTQMLRRFVEHMTGVLEAPGGPAAPGRAEEALRALEALVRTAAAALGPGDART